MPCSQNPKILASCQTLPRFCSCSMANWIRSVRMEFTRSHAATASSRPRSQEVQLPPGPCNFCSMPARAKSRPGRSGRKSWSARTMRNRRSEKWGLNREKWGDWSKNQVEMKSKCWIKAEKLAFNQEDREEMNKKDMAVLGIWSAMGEFERPACHGEFSSL